jgi:hypothetical protein
MASLTVPVKLWALAAKEAGIRAALNRALAMETANFRLNLMKSFLLVI